jgi:ABC-type dipeptide/oligopeptide/nickel transport system permease component
MRRIADKLQPLAMATIVFGIILFSVAEGNYREAIKAAAASEGSDSAIEETIRKYGFDQRWYEDITTWDKITALFDRD